MGKKNKEDRSGWVAVEPEFATGTSVSAAFPAIRPASTAYQIFQKEMTSVIRDEMISSGQSLEVGNLTRAVSDRWKSLNQVSRAVYEDKAREDAARFARESHARDVEVMALREQQRKEREEVIVTEGGGRTTRSGRRREQKRKERQIRKEQRKAQKKQQRKSVPKDSDEEFDEFESEESASEDSDSEYSEEDSDSDDGSDDSSSGDSSGGRKPKKKKIPAKKKKASPPPPRQASQSVLERRERARAEKEEREQYIEQRQEDLRRDRAEQAKRRLDFLLKQSDIFSHFGNVKADKARLLSSRRTTRSSSEQGTTAPGTVEGIAVSSRRDLAEADAANADAVQAAELEENDEHQATFLTTQPSTLGGGEFKMRPYQLEGLNWMIRLQEHGVNGILADEMGLGKTLQSISVLVYMMEYQECNGPHLIVVPKSTLSNWMSELEKWAPTMKSVKFHGNKEEREQLANEVLQPGQKDAERTWNVCVTTYEVCNIDRQVLNKFAWTYLVIDEAHRLKNEASAFSKTVRTFETRYRLLLTGTPLQNNLHELWALLNFLVPDVFASAEQFDEWFNLDIDDADEKNRLISQLHKILRPFMLRRLKADVEKSLPPKHETILFTGMSAMQKKLYRDILLRDIDVLQSNGGGGSGSRTAILNIVMQLRKCAGHPYLFPGVEDRTLPPLGEHLVQNCGKMVLLDKLLLRLKERGHRVLLFTQMTRLLDILEDYMFMRRFQYCRIDGNTSYDQREESIDTFNADDSEKFIFLLSTRAGGLGINLQTADVVILYDSDWNPQADLQAQDRAHRIGQKREVQVFRLVTEDTVEEKIVERAQQKLKLDAMVVQQGRLKDKDKQLSSDQLLEAVRFGADKIFKSKDSSITDDDIDMILNIGKKKTQELNEKLRIADKGDMLDFKLDGGGTSVQMFEGVDYSQLGKDSAQLKAAQAQAELLGIMDIGKRERKTVSNYNEDQLYKQQLAAQQGVTVNQRRKKQTKLPKYLRLPRMEEWQMFDREALQALQDEEEKAFRSLPEEQQKLASTKTLNENQGEFTEVQPNGAEPETSVSPATKGTIDVDALPPLLSDEQQEEKKKLLAEGFTDWGRYHYSMFIKASAKHGRDNFAKISAEVGKPQSVVEDYAAAFWDENIGRKRFSEHEYDRVVKLIEKGEKKLAEIKALERGTKILLSLFDNPWLELEFTHANCKDKMFTMDEDRHLLCWAHKYGYGQWEAVKMAIRRSHTFRFDYFFRSLPTEAVGRRCEQLMKAAQREVEQMEKEAREEAGLLVEEEKKDDSQGASLNSGDKPESAGDEAHLLPPIELPMYKEVKARKRAKEEKELELEHRQLEEKVEEIENQIQEIQNRLKILQEHSKESSASMSTLSSEFPDALLPDLANLVARSGASGIVSIANKFYSQYPDRVSKRQICSKIEEIAKKEKREEGDTRLMWYVLPDYLHLLDVETLRYLRKAKEERTQNNDEKNEAGRKRRSEDEEDQEVDGAMGPDGFEPFPEYDGSEPPRECKKAFTHFCNRTRREVKKSLDPESRKDKNKVNGILRERWFSLTDKEKLVWKKWEKWDVKRYDHEMSIFEKAKDTKKRPERMDDIEEALSSETAPTSGISIPKKKKSTTASSETRLDGVINSPRSQSGFSIPKKRRIS